MDREQHVVQDAAEHYAVFVMQREAESLGVAANASSSDRLTDFHAYLRAGGLTLSDFETGPFQDYKRNADHQLPRFVERLAKYFGGEHLEFECIEKDARDAGLKADFVIHRDGPDKTVSLKNYIGRGGIARPQVGSGTFASFAASFIFDRVGVGRYNDPREAGQTFRGQDAANRSAVLVHLGWTDLVAPLAVLDQLQAEVRTEFLGPECEYYDAARLKAAVERITPRAIEATLKVFRSLGLVAVRETFLSKVGLDGKEEALFFDANNYIDSITNPRYHELRELLNDPDTTFEVAPHGQGIRFMFTNRGKTVLSTHVPFTINTNGAWYRPAERYTGTRPYNDKGVVVELEWGQRRPRKSKEIATSINTYVDLASLGVV